MAVLNFIEEESLLQNTESRLTATESFLKSVDLIEGQKWLVLLERKCLFLNGSGGCSVHFSQACVERLRCWRTIVDILVMMNWNRIGVLWRMNWHVVHWCVSGWEMMDHQMWGLMLWHRVHLQVLRWWQWCGLWCGLRCLSWQWRRVNLQVLRWWQDVCWDQGRVAVGAGRKWI
jgi:hypothetical protein